MGKYPIFNRVLLEGVSGLTAVMGTAGLGLALVFGKEALAQRGQIAEPPVLHKRGDRPCALHSFH